MSSNTVQPARQEQREEQTTAESGPSTETTDRVDHLPLDVVFELLSNERRRRVLRYLLDGTEETTLGELAEHIAAIENDKPEQALSSSERKRVYICLYQCHLPKLDDADVIDFDSDRKTVSAGSGIEVLEPYLPRGDESPEIQDSWPGYYLGVSTLGVGVFALQRVAFPADWFSGVVLGALLGAVCLLAISHLRQTDGESD